MGTFGSWLLREFDPFASCAADAAIFYAVSECGDEWWAGNVWVNMELPLGGDCVDWTGDIVSNPSEHGLVVGRPTVLVTRPGFKAGVYVRVHRLMWAWAYGYETLPDGKQVDHSTNEVITMSCWNPLCVNVRHMDKIDRIEMGNRIWTKDHSQADGVSV